MTGTPNARLEQARGAQQCFQIARHRGFENESRMRHGMSQREPPRMQCLPGKRPQRRGESGIVDIRPTRLTIDRIADNGPSARGQMHADLMHASGDQRAAEERHSLMCRGDVPEAFEPGEALRADGSRRHDSPAVAGIASQPETDLSASDVHATVHPAGALAASVDAIERCSTA